MTRTTTTIRQEFCHRALSCPATSGQVTCDALVLHGMTKAAGPAGCFSYVTKHLYCAQNDTFDDDEGYDDPYGDDADEGPVY